MNIDLAISTILKKPQEGTLAGLLAAQGERVRGAKQESKEWQKDGKVLDEIWLHLALKSFDFDLGNVPEDQRGPKTIKLRWRVVANGSLRLAKNSYGSLEPLRFQNIFENRFYLTGVEVKEAIEKYMAKPKVAANMGDIGSLLKIELVEKGADSKKNFVTLTESSSLRMPLAFPGPWMASETVFELRVTYAGENFPSTTPQFYLDKKFIPQLFDAGVNLTDEKFAKTMPAPLDRSFGAGVSQMLSLTLDYEDAQKSIAICERFPNAVFTTVGIHPYKAKLTPHSEEKVAELKALIAANPRTVRAVGEIGLDYKHIGEGEQGEKDKALEKTWFEAQLGLAASLGLPAVVHERLAFNDCFAILQKHFLVHPQSTVVINCFTGNEAELKLYLGLSSSLFFIFTGFLASDDRGSHLRDLVKIVPRDRLLIGSDAPQLIPFNMPRPYPRRNEPAFLPYVLVKVAECLNEEPFAVAKLTADNARKLFVVAAPLFDGRAPNERRVNNAYFQKDEDERVEALAKQKQNAPRRLELAAEQEVFVLKFNDQDVGYVVNAKEKAILEKQSQAKEPAEVAELAAVLELKPIEPKTTVVRKGSADIVFASQGAAPKKKPAPAANDQPAQRGRGARGGRGGGRGGRGGGRGGRGGRGRGGRGRGRGGAPNK